MFSLSNARQSIMKMPRSLYTRNFSLMVAALAGIIIRLHWDDKEGWFLNVFLLLVSPPSLAALASPTRTISMEEQVAYLDSFTRKMEASQHYITDSLARWLLGNDIAAASFGTKTQTEVLEFSVPSRETDRSIPVTCAIPQQQQQTMQKLPLVLYFYCGGLIMGSPKAELLTIRFIAREASAVVCAISYRKAPRYPFPAATDDAYDASLYLIQNNIIGESAKEMIDSSRIATFGLSAGGYLAGITSRRLAVEGEISVRVQVSRAPMAKPHGGTHSIISHGRRDMWNRELNSYAWTVYLPGDDGTLVSDWKVSILVDPPQLPSLEGQDSNSSDSVLGRQPMVYLQINRRDILFDEGKLYARKLEQQKKLLELVELDTIHGGSTPPFSNGGPGDRSLQKSVEALRKYL